MPAPNWLLPRLDPNYENTAAGLRARAQRAEREVEGLRSTVRAIHNITRPGYPAENAAEIVAEAHHISEV